MALKFIVIFVRIYNA